MPTAVMGGLPTSWEAVYATQMVTFYAVRPWSFGQSQGSLARLGTRVIGQNSRSVPRGGHRHPVLLQVLHARIDMGTVRRQRSQAQSGAITRPVASPEPQTRLCHMLSARYERSPWLVGAS